MPTELQTSNHSAFRVVLFSSSDIATPVLKSLVAAKVLAGVVTNEDKPQGRKLKIAPNPLAATAAALQDKEKASWPIFKTDSLKEEPISKALAELKADFFLTFAYGAYMPKKLLAMPKVAAVNLHPSTLPKYRGASPIQAAILAGETKTALSLIQMIPRMDAGPIYAQLPLSIQANDTGADLAASVAQLAGDKIMELLTAVAGGLEPWPQEETQASFCTKLYPEDGAIDWQKSAQEIHNQVRGLQPLVDSYAILEGRRYKIFTTRLYAPADQSQDQDLAQEKAQPQGQIHSQNKAHPEDQVQPAVQGLKPGSLLLLTQPKRKVLVVCGSEKPELLELVEVQSAKGKRVPAWDWAQNLPKGSAFESAFKGEERK